MQSSDVVQNLDQPSFLPRQNGLHACSGNGNKECVFKMAAADREEEWCWRVGWGFISRVLGGILVGSEFNCGRPPKHRGQAVVAEHWGDGGAQVTEFMGRCVHGVRHCGSCSSRGIDWTRLRWRPHRHQTSEHRTWPAEAHGSGPVVGDTNVTIWRGQPLQLRSNHCQCNGPLDKVKTTI